MTPMTIVNLAQHPQYLRDLALWHQAEWHDLNPGETLEGRIQRMQDYLSPDLLPSTFVHLLNGQATGSAALIECDMDSHRQLTPWLASVFVAPQYRHQGIGSALVNHVMEQARLAGIEKLYLFTPDRSDFYRRLGWRRLFEVNYRDHQVTVMVAKLEDQSVAI